MEKIKNIIIEECMVRVFKNQLKGIWRLMSKNTTVVSDQPHKEAAVIYLNTIIGRDERYRSFWDSNVREDLAKMFPDVLTPEERECENFNEYVRTHLNTCAIMKSLFKSVGIKLGKKSYQQIEENPLEYEFVEPDIKRIDSKITHLKLATYADGMLNLHAGMNSKSEYGRQRFLTTARESMCRLFTCSKPMVASSLTEIYMALFKYGKPELKPLALQNFQAAVTLTLAFPNSQIELKAKVMYFAGKNMWHRYKQKDKIPCLDVIKSKIDLLREAQAFCETALSMDPNCTNATKLRDKITLLRVKEGDDMNIEIKAAVWPKPSKVADPALYYLQFRK